MVKRVLGIGAYGITFPINSAADALHALRAARYTQLPNAAEAEPAAGTRRITPRATGVSRSPSTAHRAWRLLTLHLRGRGAATLGDRPALAGDRAVG